MFKMIRTRKMTGRVLEEGKVYDEPDIEKQMIESGFATSTKAKPTEAPEKENDQ